MNHRERIMCQLSYRRLARGASIRYFGLPLGSLVSPGSPLSPASLGRIIYLVLWPRLTDHIVCNTRLCILCLLSINQVFHKRLKAQLNLQLNMPSILYVYKYTQPYCHIRNHKYTYTQPYCTMTNVVWEVHCHLKELYTYYRWCTTYPAIQV